MPSSVEESGESATTAESTTSSESFGTIHSTVSDETSESYSSDSRETTVQEGEDEEELTVASPEYSEEGAEDTKAESLRSESGNGPRRLKLGRLGLLRDSRKSKSSSQLPSAGVGRRKSFGAHSALGGLIFRPSFRHTSLINATAGVSNVLEGVRSVRKSAKDGTMPAYYPITMHDGTGNMKTFPFPKNVTRTTKYTPGLFLFRFLYEQYKKATNIFFLLTMVVSLIPELSPVNPLTSVLPVVFVLAVAGVKEAIEDIQRRRADIVVNSQLFDVCQERGEFRPTKSADIRVGDIVLLHENQRVPADMVVLRTSLPDGLCYIETSQLDGETNLKSFHAPPFTAEMSADELLAMHGTIVSDKPTHQLKSFHSRIIVDKGRELPLLQEGHVEPSVVVPLSDASLLLQGAFLRNTKEAYCVVVYTGKHTKLSLNQRKPPSKFGRTDMVMNSFVYILFGVIAALVVLAGSLAGDEARRAGPHWYLFGNEAPPGKYAQAVKMMFSHFVTLSYMIPMSMVVTLEIGRFLQAILISNDNRMTHDIVEDDGTVGRCGATAKTSNLNDELSLVRYVFSDKTGTLTENRMVFNQCYIGGRLFKDPMSGEVAAAIEAGGGGGAEELYKEFMTCLALCNSIVPEKKEGSDRMFFAAQSPDETALCQAAEANGYVFSERTQRYLVLRVPGGEEVRYNIVASIDFSSERRRMSVILRDPDGRVVLYTKGADNVMLDLVAPEQRARVGGGVNLVESTKGVIAGFSRVGLRTLVIAARVIPEDEIAGWVGRYDEACSIIGDREGAVRALFEELETGMELLGCTAVEDKLQEGVPEAIHGLLRAGIQVWMITGDKQETAINIGKSCRLVADDARLIIADKLADSNCESALRQLIDEARQARRARRGGSALVINGASTHIAVNYHATLFMELVSLVDAVVCCQVTPLQKAQIVQCVRDQTRDVCLAIGDGANDVSMIQTAHIGVGIYGHEGTQAARASDFAVRQFRDLLPLITIHGRYSIVRSSSCIKYSFYKNVSFFVSQFLFGFHCRFSAQIIYDDWLMTFFNIFCTMFPPFFLCVLEKDIPEQLILKCYAMEHIQRDHLWRRHDHGPLAAVCVPDGDGSDQHLHHRDAPVPALGDLFALWLCVLCRVQPPPLGLLLVRHQLWLAAPRDLWPGPVPAVLLGLRPR